MRAKSLIALSCAWSAAALGVAHAGGHWWTAAAAASTPPLFLSRIQQGPWRGGLEPGPEIAAPVTVEVVEGALPADLRGTLYRNGAGRLRVGVHPYGHWFDGDGYVTRLTLGGAAPAGRGVGRGSSGATYSARYVRTARFAAQETAGSGAPLASRGAWTQRGDPASPWRWLANLGRLPTNPSNTHVIPFAGRCVRPALHRRSAGGFAA